MPSSLWTPTFWSSVAMSTCRVMLRLAVWLSTKWLCLLLVMLTLSWEPHPLNPLRPTKRNRSPNDAGKPTLHTVPAAPGVEFLGYYQ